MRAAPLISVAFARNFVNVSASLQLTGRGHVGDTSGNW